MSRFRDENDAHRADGQHLKSVPDAEQDYEMEPPRAATLDERGAPEGDGQVGAGKKHGWHAPLQSLPGADQVEQDVARHVAAQEVANLGAGCPQ